MHPLAFTLLDSRYGLNAFDPGLSGKAASRPARFLKKSGEVFGKVHEVIIAN